MMRLDESARETTAEIRLTAYVLGEMSGPEARAFEREAAHDPILAARVAGYRRTLDETRVAFSDEEPTRIEPPPRARPWAEQRVSVPLQGRRRWVLPVIGLILLVTGGLFGLALMPAITDVTVVSVPIPIVVVVSVPEPAAAAPEPDATPVLVAPEPVPPTPTPEPAPKPRPPRVAAPKAATGLLQILARPWAQINIDGRPSGSTPKTIELPVGKHQVALTNGGRVITKSVTIKAGEATRVSHDFDD